MADSLKKLLKDDRLLHQAASQAFMEADSDKSGLIDEAELSKVLTKVCISLNCSKPTPSQVKELLKKIDHSQDGKINLEEFMVLIRMILKLYIKKLEGESEPVNAANSEIPAKKTEDAEHQINKQLHLFEKYLQDSGISVAFQIIYTEILMKKIDSDNVFTYTAMRLRQIGKEVAHLLPANLTDKIVESSAPKH